MLRKEHTSRKLSEVNSAAPEFNGHHFGPCILRRDRRFPLLPEVVAGLATEGAGFSRAANRKGISRPFKKQTGQRAFAQGTINLLQSQVNTNDKTDQQYQSKKAMYVAICNHEVNCCAETAFLMEGLEYAFTRTEYDHHHGINSSLARDYDDAPMIRDSVPGSCPIQKWYHLAQDQGCHRRLGEGRKLDRVLLHKQFEQQKDHHKGEEKKQDLRRHFLD